jgi:DNA-binding response OmpR family regulator
MRILIVEDELKLAKATARALELQRHAVDTAQDGQVGFDLASTEAYDLIILDVMLPSMDGIEICRQLRTAKNETPILMLTAKGQLSDKTTGLDTGADDYLVKPFALEELFSRVRALGRRTTHHRQPTLQVHDLSLDPITFKVTRAGRVLELSHKEFALLEYLLRHKNTVLSKQQIVAHVWNYDADVLPSTVEVHMKNLRDKVDKPFPTALLQTVRGFGYEVRDV